MAIPKRIVQIWGGTAELPAIAKASATNIRLLLPDFEYRLYDDEAIRDFLSTEPKEHQDAYDGFAAPIQRYDFLRYLLVYRLGGFYFDTDVLLIGTFNHLLDKPAVFPFDRLTWSETLRTKHGMDWELGNFAFGAEQGHRLLGLLIDNCLRARKDASWAVELIKDLPSALREDLRIIFTTGPGMVTRTLAENPHLLESTHVLFPEDVFAKSKCWSQFGHYGVHLGVGGWRPRYQRLRKWLVNTLAHRNESRAFSFSRSLEAKWKDTDTRPQLAQQYPLATIVLRAAQPDGTISPPSLPGSPA